MKWTVTKLADTSAAIEFANRIFRDDCHLQAIESFRAARKLAPQAGVVKSLLRLFNELVKCDEEGVLKDVRQAVEGK